MKLNAKEIQIHGNKIAELHNEIHRTVPFRDCGIKEKYLQYRNAIEAWRTYDSPLYEFWNEDFLTGARKGDRDSVDTIITYLEVDPFYFRSGYLKERLLKIIKQAPRNRKDNRRLQRVIWNHLGGPNRREFHHYRRLAKQVCDPEFIDSLKKISPSIDLKAKGKFSNLYKYLINQTP